jgi:hypothetical protein
MIIKNIKNKQFKRRNKDYNENKLECVGVAQDLMPYGTGFVYIKNMTVKERTDIVADVTKQVGLVIDEFLKNVNVLSWMTAESKLAVKTKGLGF